MLCQRCTEIPLNIFLPFRARSRSSSSGRMWSGSYQHYEDIPGESPAQEKLEASAKGGCGICVLIRHALNEADNDWKVSVPYNDTEPTFRAGTLRKTRDYHRRYHMDKGIVLRCKDYEEGGLDITDDTCQGELWWNTMGMGIDPAHRLHRFASDPAVFQLCRDWLETCRSTHGKCNTFSSPDEAVPTRLVEIQNDPRVSPALRLVTTRQEGSKTLAYTALSYCRGTGRGFAVTLRENVAARDTSLPWADLSKTMQDAILVTWELGLRYIWIDSMCIVQDDVESINEDCARMDAIYARSQVTLAASDADDAEYSFFHERDARFIHGYTYTAKNKPSDSSKYHLLPPGGQILKYPDSAEVTLLPKPRPWRRCTQGSLESRGWTLQERQLSTRVLHFTRTRVLWECRICIASEDHPEMQDKAAADRTVGLWPMRPLDLDENTTAVQYQSILADQLLWGELMEDYSSRQLSFATDKLLAIAGIARGYSHILQDDYLAGIWRKGMLPALTWYPAIGSRRRVAVEPSRPMQSTDHRIPSWSWASYDGPVKFTGKDWFGSTWQNLVNEKGETKYVKAPPPIRVLAASTVLATADPFGTVTGGEITLQGHTLELHLSEVNHDPGPTGKEELKFYTVRFAGSVQASEDGSTAPEKALPDEHGVAVVYFDQDPSVLAQSTLICIALGPGRPAPGGPPGRECGLALMALDHGAQLYRRVGMFDVGSKDPFWNEKRVTKAVTII